MLETEQERQAGWMIKRRQSERYIGRRVAAFLYFRRPGRTLFAGLLIYFFFWISEITRYQIVSGGPEIAGRY